MKYSKEFEKWLDKKLKNCDFSDIGMITRISILDLMEDSWSACEAFMDSRKCENCKSYRYSWDICVDDVSCCEYVSEDFYCKEWRHKDEKEV